MSYTEIRTHTPRQQQGANRLVEIPLQSNLTQIRRMTPKMDLPRNETPGEYLILLEVQKRVRKEIETLINTRARRNHIRAEYIYNNIMVEQERCHYYNFNGKIHETNTLPMTNLRFKKRDKIIIKLWVETESEMPNNLLLGNDFLQEVSPYMIQQDRIIITINQNSVVLEKIRPST